MNDTISLGEVFHRVALSIHDDLKDVTNASASKTTNREINTRAMIGFVSRTRRKLLQLLATVKWLSTPRTKRILDALDTYYFNLQDFERRCEAATGEMFFVHSRIYSMRSPRPLIEDAMTLMTAKRVRGSLPPAVFQSGRREYPQIEEDFMKKLSSVIKMKLFREKSNLVLNDVVKGSLRDGVLTIVYGNLFTFSCTLLTSSLESSWRVLAYTIVGAPGYEKYWKRRGEEVQEFLSGERVRNCPALRSLINRAHHNALLCRLADICDQVKHSIKSLQPIQVIQDVRKGLQASSCVFGFWKSEYSSQYQVHFVFAVDHIEEENDETFAPLLVSATAVTAGDYRVDYTMSNLSEVTSPLKSVEQLRSLILKGPSVHELSLALVQPIIDLKLQYLLCRLPSFPPNMNVRYERQGQSVLLYSGSYCIALQLDAITGRFYFNSSKSEVLHGNLERFLLEVNSVETENDFLAYYTATLHDDPETMASSVTFRPLTTADLVVAYLKTMDLDSSLLISSCQRVTPQEDRSLQFQVPSQTLFAKYWRRRHWIQANELRGQGDDGDAAMDFGENVSQGAGNNNDDQSISTAGASMTLTRTTAATMATANQRSRHHRRRLANQVVWMMYYGYVVGDDFSVILTVILKRLYLQTKLNRLEDMEHIDSVDLALSPDHLLRSDSDILGQWVQLEQSLLNKVEGQMLSSNASVAVPFLSEPQFVAYTAAPSEKTPLLIQLKSIVSKAYGSGNLALWPLRSEQKELSVALVQPLNDNATGNTIDVFFVSASSAAPLLNIDLSSSKKAAEMQSLLTTQSGSPIYASAKLFASFSLQLFRHVDVASSQATISQRFRLASLQLFHRYVMDTDEALRKDKLARCQNHVTKAIRCILHHYRQVADTPCRLQDIQPMVLTIRAVILFLAICSMDLQQVKAQWSFAKHELQCLNVHIRESTLLWSFRWNQAQQNDEGSGNGGLVTAAKAPSASKTLLGYMSARLVLPDDRKVVPVMTFIDLRNNRQLQLSVEDMSLVNVADFFNMDRFDDS